MSLLASALQDAGGPAAPRERGAQLRRLLMAELDRGEHELTLSRSGRDEPVVVAIAAAEGDAPALVAAVPATPALRADAGAVGERAWLLVAAVVGALQDISGAPAPTVAGDLALRAGDARGHLALHVPVAKPDPELAVLAFEDQVAPVARLRARALALPGHVVPVADLRPPLAQPLRIAEAVARLGGRAADGASVAEHEEAVLALLEPGGAMARPHDDPQPARRIARRILQRLHGMGKWGGYHTDFAHLSRGFAGNERASADAVGEALLEAGLLSEKPSVGQRHVFLDPRRAADIHALIERGDLPRGLRLP